MSNKTIYFITCEGCYIQGILHISFDLEEAIEIANQLAIADGDSYHYWNVNEYQPLPVEELKFNTLTSLGVQPYTTIYSRNKGRIVMDNRES